MILMTEKKIAIFRTKSQILIARDLNGVAIAENVLKNPVFEFAKMHDVLGFMAEPKGDYEIVDVMGVKNDPKAFLRLAFGEESMIEKMLN